MFSNYNDLSNEILVGITKAAVFRTLYQAKDADTRMTKHRGQGLPKGSAVCDINFRLSTQIRRKEKP